MNDMDNADNVDVRALVKENAYLKGSLEFAKQQMEEMRQQHAKEKEELMTRLSRMASSKLRENNPCITDLSDPNRPTKLAEQMSELYDNEWTEAFEEIQNGDQKKPPDRTIIQELLHTLMNIYEKCKTIANYSSEDYFKNVQQAILGIPDTMAGQNIVMPSTLKQEIKEFRKMQAAKLSTTIAEEIKKEVTCSMGPKMVEYFEKCVDICWKAVVQDPPVVLSLCKEGSRFKKGEYRDFTARGPFVEYVVWPCLQLHENGPILCKGVAQGTHDSTTDNSTEKLKETLESLSIKSNTISMQNTEASSKHPPMFRTIVPFPKPSKNEPKKSKWKDKNRPYPSQKSKTQKGFS